MKVIETDRLILRSWKEQDIETFANMHEDERVIEFLRGKITLQEAKDFADSMNQLFEKKKICFFATELKGTAEFIGFVGLAIPPFVTDFTPCVEIGWRLSAKYWNRGHATEAAKSVLKYGFEIIGLKEIVAFTVPDNKRSINVMEKIGMKRDENGDFNHPLLPKDHKLSRHILYRISK